MLGPSVRGPKADKHEAWAMITGLRKDSFPANGQPLRCGTMAPGNRKLNMLLCARTTLNGSLITVDVRFHFRA